MLAVQRVRGFSLPQELSIEKARINQALKAFALEGKPLCVNGTRFVQGQEQEINIALASMLVGKPLYACLYRLDEGTNYFVGTVGHSFDIDGVKVSLLFDLRTNLDLILLSTFSIRILDGVPQPFVDVYLDGVENVISSQYPVFKVARALYSSDELISHVLFICALKEFFRVRANLRLAGQDHPPLEPVSYFVPSAWAVPLHEFALEIALERVPNKEPFLKELSMVKDSYPFDVDEGALQGGSARIIKGFCDHVQLDPDSLVSFGHLQLLYSHLFGRELWKH